MSTLPTALRQWATIWKNLGPQMPSGLREAAAEIERLSTLTENLDLGQRALAEYSKKLEAQVITLRAALEAVDSRLLHVLADWFDSTDRPGRGTEVQESLRQWASVIEAALKGSEQ